MLKRLHTRCPECVIMRAIYEMAAIPHARESESKQKISAMHLKTPIYTNPECLNSEQHMDYFFEAQPNFDFAKSFHACPIAIIEFGLIARHYPIAFITVDQQITPIAVLGIRKGRNVFIDSQGQWQSNTYIPTLLRAYPFTVGPSADATYSLMMDTGSRQANKEERGTRLFREDGSFGEQLNIARQFLESFQTHLADTQRMCNTLSKLDVLQQNPTQFTFPTGEAASINTYLTIDKGRLHTLHDSELGHLAKEGFLEAFYLHLNSLNNFDQMIKLTRSTRR